MSDIGRDSSKDSTNDKGDDTLINDQNDSVDINLLMIQRQKTSRSGHGFYTDKNVWTQRSSNYISHMEKVKQLELNRNKFAFIIYRPIPSIIICLTIGALILSIGITMVIFSKNVDTIIIKYNENDADPIKFEVKTQLNAPVYIYYRILNFYATHKKYANDASHNVFVSNNCLGINTLHQLIDLRCFEGKNTLYSGTDGNKMCEMLSRKNLDILNKNIYPCGISSATIMTDEYDICSDIEGKKCYEFTMPVDSRENDLFRSLFEYDENKFVWIDPTNIRLRRWNATPFSPNFQVLYGIIERDIPVGTYYLKIKNNIWPSREWNAGKEVALLTTTIFGDKATVLIMIIFALGSLYLLTGIFFLFLHYLTCMKPANDLDDLIKTKITTNIKDHSRLPEVEKDCFSEYIEPNEKRMPCLCPLH